MAAITMAAHTTQPPLFLAEESLEISAGNWTGNPAISEDVRLMGRLLLRIHLLF